MLAAGVIAIAPFVIRIVRGYPILGDCLPSDGCDIQTGIELRFMSLVSLGVNFFFVSWWCFLLTGTYFAYDERKTLMERLFALLHRGRAEDSTLPFLKFESAQNIIVWSKLRTFVVTFKSVELRKCEIILASLVLIFCVIFPFVIINAIHPVASQINSDVLYVISGYSMAALGIYLAYPTVYTALSINDVIEQIKFFLADEKWRLSIRSKVAKSDEKRQQIGFAYTVAKALHKNLVEGDYTFKILGITVDKAFFISLVGAIVAAAASWASTLAG